MNRGQFAACLFLAVLSLPLYADRGDDSYKRGVNAERRGDYDEAYAQFKQSYGQAPTNPKFMSAYARLRFQAATQHVRSAELLRSRGALTEALAELQRAVEIDSSNFSAQQELRRVSEMIRRQERQASAPKVETPPVRVAEEVADTVQLRPISDALINMHMTVNADVAYRTIGKLAGVNVLIDPEFHAQKITLDLNDVTLREALEMLRLQSKTFWRPVSSNTIFVAGDSPGKRKDIEQNVMKTFYLRNLTAPAELQEAANTLRQILDLTRVQLNPAQGAVILRGTPDQMLLAEKLLADIDKPKAEVVINIAVMQVNRDRLRTLGTTVPTSFSAGLVSGGAAAAGFTVKSLGKLNSGNFAVGIPGASFTVLATDSNTKLLQNPEIRTLNEEKATLRIGDRVPIAVGSFQPGIVGGGGVSPLVSTQFQYLDVGVNIDITPHIHSVREVTLKMALEISAVTGSENIGGITQPVIGQRRMEHVTRLIDGEVNLLGGILEEAETQSLSGYPWLSRLPILKYLFAQESKMRRENEIVFAITPHIVRSQELTEDNTRVIEIGTGSSIELRRKSSTPAPDHTKAATPKPAESLQRVPPAVAPRAGNVEEAEQAKPRR